MPIVVLEGSARLLFFLGKPLFLTNPFDVKYAVAANAKGASWVFVGDSVTSTAVYPERLSARLNSMNVPGSALNIAVCAGYPVDEVSLLSKVMAGPNDVKLILSEVSPITFTTMPQPGKLHSAVFNQSFVHEDSGAGANSNPVFNAIARLAQKHSYFIKHRAFLKAQIILTLSELKHSLTGSQSNLQLPDWSGSKTGWTPMFRDTRGPEQSRKFVSSPSTVVEQVRAYNAPLDEFAEEHSIRPVWVLYPMRTDGRRITAKAIRATDDGLVKLIRDCAAANGAELVNLLFDLCDDDEFADSHHLNVRGSIHLSEVLASRIPALLKTSTVQAPKK
jgi:hypothetical protein